MRAEPGSPESSERQLYPLTAHLDVMRTPIVLNPGPRTGKDAGPAASVPDQLQTCGSASPTVRPVPPSPGVRNCTGGREDPVNGCPVAPARPEGGGPGKTENTQGISDRHGLKKGFLGCIPGTEGASPAVPVRTPPGAPKCSKSHGPRRLGVFQGAFLLPQEPKCIRSGTKARTPKPDPPTMRDRNASHGIRG